MCIGVQWQASVPLPEPEKATTMLYGGVSGSTGGVGGVGTDGIDVVRQRQSGWWGFCQVAYVRPWHFGEETPQKLPSLK